MARKKITEQVLSSWDEVNDSLKLIGDAQNEIAVIEAEMNEQILKLKAEAKDRIKPYEANIKVHEMMVQQYTAAHREDLKGKSLKLAFGTVGFRLSTKLVLPKKLDQVIENLKKNGMMDCLNIKTLINKDTLKTYEEEDILRVGGTLQKEDTFWYEITRDTVQD